MAIGVETGRATLNVAKGDLALSAPEGFVDLMAGRGIRGFSPGSVRLESVSPLEQPLDMMEIDIDSMGAARVRAKGARHALSEVPLVKNAEVDLRDDRNFVPRREGTGK